MNNPGVNLPYSVIFANDFPSRCPGFVAAIDLELSANRKDLIYEKEYNLNTKPLEIDLLVIKKERHGRTGCFGISKGMESIRRILVREFIMWWTGFCFPLRLL